MTNYSSLRAEIEQELADAEKSRQQNNEGRARVHARRASGKAMLMFLEGQMEQTEMSSLEALVWAAQAAQLPEKVREIASHLTQRVNTDYQLPSQIDLIAEARQLIKILDQIKQER